MSAALTATAATLLTGLQEFGASGVTDMRKHAQHAIDNSMLHVSPLFIGSWKKDGLPK
jgi:hypothetical protein